MIMIKDEVNGNYDPHINILVDQGPRRYGFSDTLIIFRKKMISLKFDVGLENGDFVFICFQGIFSISNTKV